ncbi:MAG: Arabinose trans protein, partial [Actinomycetota bacterium]|nr:Arabinose trans protein [Actinomycetota bacterium]
WFVRRRVIDQVVPTRSLPTARAGGACAVVLAVPSLALLLRPEPAVAVLVAVALGLAVRYLRRPDPWVVGALALVAAAALGVHQGGWAVAGICVAMLPTLVGWWRAATRPAAAILPQLLAAAALLVLLLMLGTNAWLWWRSVQAFSADPGYGGIFDEAATLYPLGAGLGFGAVPSRVMFYGVAIVAALAFLIRSSPLRGRVATGAGVAAALAALGLALSASKNPVHAAAVVPAVAVLLAMALGDVSEAARPWSRLVGAACGLAVLTYLGTVTVRVMTPSTQESAGQTSQPWFAGGWLALVVLAVALVTALAIGRLLKDDRQRLAPPDGVGAGARAASMTAVITATIAAGISVLTTLGPAAAQAGDPASWVGQNTAALRGEGCGLAGEAAGGVPTAVRPLPLAVGAPVLATVAVPTPPVANPNPLIPADTPPFADTPVLANPLTPTGWVATEWYSTAGLDTVAIWARSRFTGITFEVVFGDDSGAEIAREQLVRDGEAAPIWLAFRPRIPSGTTRVAFSWATDSGPPAVTAPVQVVASSSVAQLASGGPVWNNPQTHLQAPCVPMPTIADGLISRYEYSVGRPNLNGAGYVSQMRTAQLACPVESRAAAGRCLYRLGPALLPAIHRVPATETVGWL